MRRPDSRSFKSLIRGGYVRIVLIFVDVTEGEKNCSFFEKVENPNGCSMHVREKIGENNAYAGNDDESVDEKRERIRERKEDGARTG